ncbi:PA3496 family putative envelope integrity protein [Legionella sp. D16C41]|uniref:PA3496 family putative envelope integrity protein n=1 Tax=Legionella sp. D16C41 TaxID=3402688 RepID=UPI003AF86CCC
MSDLFDEDDDLLEEVFSPEDSLPLDTDIAENTILDARRRLEQALEEKRLRDELDDFVDY